MNRAWWRSLSELDAHQREFVDLPVEGKYLLVGPPGSGKTNLLLLRAQYFAGRGDKNVLFVTFTRELAGFIRTGIARRGVITRDQIRTYQSWGYRHVLEFGSRDDLPGSDADFDSTREQLLAAISRVRSSLPSRRLYDGIFVDEAQDLTVAELKVLLELSDRVCVSGDSNQGIYQKDGLGIAEDLGLQVHELTAHFRIGPRVARVADRLIQPESGQLSLEASSNYDSSKFGESSAVMHVCADRDEQFNRMVDEIRVQLDAFPDEDIGILCGKRSSVAEVGARFERSDLSDRVSVHGQGDEVGFADGSPIHVLTIHSAKGTEFRAVHLYGAEELHSWPLNRRRLSYTAVTRAKTALRAYRTGNTNEALESAFAEADDFDWTNLLEDDDD